MTKSKKVSAQKTKHHRLLYAAGAILALVILLQAALLNNLYQRLSRLEDDEIKTLVIDAVDNMHDRPAIDPATGKAYVPEARLVLPPHTDVKISYYGDKDMLFFSDRSNMTQAVSTVRNARDLAATFDSVPGLQACSRQAILQFKEDDGSFKGEKVTLRETKTLADGRKAYIYTNGTCKGNPSNLVQYLKQVESY